MDFSYMYPQASEAQSLSLRGMRTWARPTKVCVKSPVAREPLKLFKPGPVKDVVVERDRLESSACEIYDSVKDGEVRQLLAGTGCGKTTRLPLYIARQYNTVGIVVLPDRALAREVYKFCRDVMVVRDFQGVSVINAVEVDDILNLASPGVVYISACDLLGVVANDLEVVNGSRVGFIYVDESHEKLPEYYVLRLIVGGSFFQGVKVFMGSATASSDNLESRGQDTKRTLAKIKPADANYAEPMNLTTRSPLHYSAIKDRTMVFLPTALDMERLIEYYDDNGIETMTYSELSSPADLRGVKTFLSRGRRPLALMVTQTVQTGYTFDVDTVVDCGVSVDLSCSLDNSSVKIIQRKVTMSERIQRCGRVGRHMPGSAYYIDADTVQPPVDVIEGTQLYVALWCRLLQITVNVPVVRDVNKLVQKLTLSQVAAALHANVHPAVFIHYISRDGVVPAQLRPLSSLLFSGLSDVQVLFPHDVSVDCTTWVNRRLPSVDWVKGVSVYRSPCDVPFEWTPVVFVMSNLVERHKADYEPFDFDDNASVITTLKGKTSDKTDRVRSRYLSRMETRKQRRTTTLDSIDVASLRGDISKVRDVNSWVSAEVDKELPTVPTVDYVNYDDGRVSSSTRRRRSGDAGRLPHRSKARSRKSSSSASIGTVLETVSRKKFDPKNLSSQKVFPLDDKLCDDFLKRDTVTTERDHALYSKLQRYRREIASLGDQDREEYFLATISQWNRAVMSSLQLQAKPLTFMERNFMSHRELHPHEETKQSCKKLLCAFDFAGLKIAVPKSSHQCSDNETPMSDHVTARYALSIGNDYTRDTVDYLKYKLVEYYLGDKRRGLYLSMRDFSVGVNHTFVETCGEHTETLKTPRADVCAVRSDVVMDFIVFVHALAGVVDREARLRVPEPGEMVLVVSVSEFTHEQVLYGPYRVFDADSEWFYTGVLVDGTSGSVVV